MEEYPKLFIKSGLLYLLVGVVLGAAISIAPELSFRLRFVHIHLNLLGFMTMAIAGVAYHVLPRFSARKLPWPDGVKYHFILHNVGLIGMLLAHLAGGYEGESWLRALFILFAVMVSGGILIMIYNLYFVLVEPKVLSLPITADKKVGEVLEAFPQAMPVFLESGFAALANPAARATFAKVVTLKKACQMHSVDIAEFLEKLNAAVINEPQPAPAPPKPTSEEGGGKTIEKGEYCQPDIVIGSLIKVYPQTKAIFEKHYGEGCFSCPGHTFETVAQTAQMHNIDPDLILKEINAAIRSALKG